MSVSLNGSSSFLTITSSFGGITRSSAKSFCGWFKPTANNVDQCALTQINPDGFGNSDLGLNFTTGGALAGFANGGAAASFGSITGGVWYFLYGCRSTANNTDEFGVSATGSGFDADGDFTSQGGNVIVTGDATAWSKFDIGRRGTNGKFFGGELCCVRIFTAKLTKAQFRAEAVSTTPVLTGSLAADWRFADTTAGYLLDSTGTYTLTATTITNGGIEPTELTTSAFIPRRGLLGVG